jgi:hypothetical protein
MNDHSVIFASFNSQTPGCFQGFVTSGDLDLCPLYRGAVQ